MPIPQRTAPWARKHDRPGLPLNRRATILYPQSLADLIEICVKQRPGLVAAGSHWALSLAAVADKTFIETNDPNNVEPAMGRTLYDVVPGCLTPAALQDLDRLSKLPGLPPEDLPYYVHIETGKRIYQLYAELDRGEGNEPKSLAHRMDADFRNTKFMSSWAFKTLGGAGGQTVFGALTTGTHGADIHFPPVADSVKAIHLVVDGGRHYWIEPAGPSWITPRPGAVPFNAPFTDTAALKRLYGEGRFKSPDPAAFPDAGKFDVIRDDKTFNAVLMSPGRFGIVYSIVLEAVPQYGLHESRNLTDWQTIKNVIRDPNNMLYDRRFLNIAVNLAPHDNGAKNRCAITKRWNVPVTTAGRAERVGVPVPPPAPNPDPRLNATRFSMAGNSVPFDPKPSGSFLDAACSSANFSEAVIQTVHDEIKEFIDTHICHSGGAIATTAALGGGPGLAALIPALIIILALLALFLEALKHHADPRLGQVLDDLRKVLLDQPTPERRAAGVFVWRAIALRLFESRQSNRQYEAISYAVLDGYDYKDKSCNVNADSVEVFFDATDSRLISFVDQILRYECNQEFSGYAAAGYMSLRFMTRTRALIGPQRHALTCAVEVAALKDVVGSEYIVDFATTLARDMNINGILHWGQRNDCTMDEIQRRFGDRTSNPTGPLRAWRTVLSDLTENGRLDAFSTKFTRAVGLEIVTPKIRAFSARVIPAGPGRAMVAHYDCIENPPATKLRLEVTSPSGQRSTLQLAVLGGDETFAVNERGDFKLKLVATLAVNGESRDATSSLVVNVV